MLHRFIIKNLVKILLDGRNVRICKVSVSHFLFLSYTGKWNLNLITTEESLKRKEEFTIQFTFKPDLLILSY